MAHNIVQVAEQALLHDPARRLGRRADKVDTGTRRTTPAPPHVACPHVRRGAAKGEHEVDAFSAVGEVTRMWEL
jgi:hypothetical protein